MPDYTADHRAEELQVLRQLQRGPIEVRHSATLKVVERLVEKDEAFLVKGWAELSAGGRRALRTDHAARKS